MTKHQAKTHKPEKPQTPEIPEGWAEQMAVQNPREINTALVKRAEAKHWNHVEKLLEIGADPSFQDYSALQTVIEKGKKDLLKQMLEIKTPPTEKHSKLLETALEHRKYQSALILIDHGFAPDCYSETDDIEDDVLNSVELCLKQAAARGSLEDIKYIEQTYSNHITCSPAIFANAASMHNHVRVLEHFMEQKIWPDQITMFQKDTADIIGHEIIRHEDELQCFQVYYTDKESFKEFDADCLTQKPDDTFTEALISLAAETRHFCNLVEGMSGNGFNDIKPHHLDHTNKYGFNVIEALHKTGELKQIIDFDLWKNNLETATHLAKTVIQNNLSQGSGIESFIEKVNKERYKRQISHQRPTIIRRRTPKM